MSNVEGKKKPRPFPVALWLLPSTKDEGGDRRITRGSCHVFYRGPVVEGKMKSISYSGVMSKRKRGR